MSCCSRYIILDTRTLSLLSCSLPHSARLWSMTQFNGRQECRRLAYCCSWELVLVKPVVKEENTLSRNPHQDHRHSAKPQCLLFAFCLDTLSRNNCRSTATSSLSDIIERRQTAIGYRWNQTLFRPTSIVFRSSCSVCRLSSMVCYPNNCCSTALAHRTPRINCWLVYSFIAVSNNRVQRRWRGGV